MAQVPALLRTNTAPVLFPSANGGGISSATMNGPRASQLSGSTHFGSTTSLNTMSTRSTVIGNGGGPVLATTNIINQTADASRSLYQICVSTKRRLAQVPGFESYMEQLASPQALADGPVESLWNLLRTGHPLLVVYNALKPATPLSVDDSIASESKRSKIAVFKFIEACLRELNMPSNECFVINNLLGNDTTGFVKVTVVINHVLDQAESRGLLKASETGPDNGTNTEQGISKMSYRDHIIKEMVNTERKYVQDLENLHDLKEALTREGVLPGAILHQIFLNINAILDFQRRFLIRVETTNSMPEEEQQWGAPFTHYEKAFDIYQDFIANQRKAAQVANQVFDKIQSIRHPVACDFNTLDGFLLKPMQRLVKYPLLLKDLNKKTEDPVIKADLVAGFEAAGRVLSKANEAVNRDLLDEAVEDLIGRVDDWKGHSVKQFGRLLLHGAHTVLTSQNNQEKIQDYEIYLFECILLCCKESPSKSKDKKDKTKAVGSKPRKNKLALKGRIFMTNVTEVLSFSKPGSHTVQIWWKGDPGVENFVLRFTNEEAMKKWASTLDQQRKENTSSATQTPDQTAPEFAWMKTVSDMQNPYATQAEESDEEDDGQSAQPHLSFGGLQQSTGGVMARNSSQTSLRARSATNDSTASLAGMVRAPPPPRFPLPPPPAPLSLQTQGVPGSPSTRNGESYFSPTTESPASTRTSTTSSMQFPSGAYPFPKTGVPQGWEDTTGNSRYTAPAMPRAPSRDGSSPVNAYTINGRNPRGPSMPAMAPGSQQSLAQQQRSRSYSTPDINGQQNQRRSNTSTPVPAVPGIPAHLHDAAIPRSQNASPMPMQQDLPMRSNTQSPGAQRERLHQSQNSFGGKMSQFPAHPIYPGRQGTPGPPGAPPSGPLPRPLQLDNTTPVAPALGTASTSNPLFSPNDQIPTQLKVKVNCDSGNYITLVVAFNITYQSMIDRIDAKLARFTNSSIGKGNLKLRYRDEDGDFVNIESDEDIQITFMEHREDRRNQYNVGGVGEIELFCVGQTG